MVLRNVAKIIIAAGEAVGKAFTRAIKEELNASKQAAERHASSASSSTSDAGSKVRDEAKANARLGITLQESMQILDIKALDKEQIEKRFKYLFEINEKEKGGSLYIQSKVYRAKERLDAEMAKEAEKSKEKP